MEKRMLSQTDIIEALRRATTSFEGADERWQARARSGLTDAELGDVLKYEIGIAGGSSGRDILSVEYQRSGLKIWAGWQGTNSFRDCPVLEGKRTMQMAREIYGICDPLDKQNAAFLRFWDYIPAGRILTSSTVASPRSSLGIASATMSVCMPMRAISSRST